MQVPFGFAQGRLFDSALTRSAQDDKVWHWREAVRASLE